MTILQNNLQKNKLFNLLPLVVCWLSVGAVIFGLFNNAVPDTHDINTFFWAKAFYEIFQSGTAYPRWLPQLWYGFGLPVFYIYNPLFYFITLVFQLCNIGTIISIKIVLILSTLCGAYFMYLLAREFLKKNTALLTTSLFVLAPYYISLVYVRGAFPEFLALNFIPLLLWAITKMFKNINDYRYLVVGILSLSSIILAHNLTGIIAIFMLVVYVFYLYFLEKESQRFLLLNTITLLGASLITMFYWLPMMINLKNINSAVWTSGQYFSAGRFPSIAELINFNLSQSIGWLTLGIVPIFILLAGWITYREILAPVNRQRVLFFLILATFFVFLITPISDFIWTMVPYMEIFQFPARFIGISILLLALLAGLLLESLIKNPVYAQYIVIFGIIISTTLAIPLLGVRPYRDTFLVNEKTLNIDTYLKLLIDTTVDDKKPGLDRGIIASEYLPRKISDTTAEKLWLDTIEEFLDRNPETKDIKLLDYHRVISGSGDMEIKTINDDVFDGKYLIKANTNGVIKINQFEYPTWEIKLNDKPANISIIEDRAGQFIDIPKGDYTLTIRLVKQLNEKISEYVSMISLGVLLVGLILFRRKPKIT